jgi:uncharacterized protein
MIRTCTPIVEIKFADNDGSGGMEFEGYGAVFGNVDSYGDVIAPGAFKRSLRESKKAGVWPSMLLQHGGGMFGGSAEDMTPIGVWTDFTEDEKGLRITGKLADTSRGREVYSLLKMSPRPAIDGLSIGYMAKKFEVGTKPGEPRRKLTDVELLEVSLVTFPANPLARVDAVKTGRTKRHAEQALRDAGFSANEAKAILADGFSAAAIVRDADAHAATADALRQLIATMQT